MHCRELQWRLKARSREAEEGQDSSEAETPMSIDIVADRDRRALETEKLLHADARVYQGRNPPTSCLSSYHIVLSDRTWPKGRVGNNGTALDLYG